MHFVITINFKNNLAPAIIIYQAANLDLKSQLVASIKKDGLVMLCSQDQGITTSIIKPFIKTPLLSLWELNIVMTKLMILNLDLEHIHPC
jgi:hypothetical protein